MDGNYNYSSVVKLDIKRFDWQIFGSSSKGVSMQLQTDATNHVAVQIFSSSGQLIQTINKGTLAAGTYTIPLNLQSASHNIYIVKLMIDNAVYTKKIMR